MPKYSRDEYPINSVTYERSCPHCGQRFWGNKPSATYCSDKCRVYANKRKRELQQAVVAAYEATPEEAENRFGPVIVGQGKDMQLLYHNPFREELKKIDPDGTFALKHVSGQAVQPLERVIAYHTLHMRSNRLYYGCMRRVLEEDEAHQFSSLTDNQRTFLKSEQRRIDAQMMEQRTHLDRLKKSDETMFNW